MTTKTILSKPKKHHQIHDSNEVKNQQPIIPMNKVSLDVIRKLQTEPYPQLNLATHSTISDALDLYFNEYVRLFRQNQSLNDQLASILIERNSLADQFNQIKKMKSYDDNIRRRRRYASEIERNYHCPMPKCNKGYGSEGSLTHHVRLKHPHFFETGEYEIYLETYILPKQQIKNEDKDGKAINVEDLEGETTLARKINHSNGKGNKVEITYEKVKEAKEEDQSSGPKKGSENNGPKNSRKQRTPSTPLMQSLMRQVDGYIVLDDNQNQKQESEKQDDNREQTKGQEKQSQEKKVQERNKGPAESNAQESSPKTHSQ